MDVSKLVKLRPTAQNLVYYEIDGGGETYFWWDPWTPFGLLIQYLGASGPRDLGISIDSLVSDCLVNGNWTLPHPRSDRQLQLHIFISTLSLGQGNDTIIWRVNGVKREKFISKEIWNFTRERRQPCDWASLVWHAASVPKHAITSWFFMLNRNPTMDRLLSWGLDVEGTCLLCGLSQEFRDHLFFDCVYLAEVWRKCLARLGVFNAPTSWQSVIEWLYVSPRDRIFKLAVLQIWQACLYGIWQERNGRFHLGIIVTPLKISEVAVRLARSKAIALKNSGRNLGLELLDFWSGV